MCASAQTPVVKVATLARVAGVTHVSRFRGFTGKQFAAVQRRQWARVGSWEHELNTKLVNTIAATTRSRLVTVRACASVQEIARLLSTTQISLVVVCEEQGTMVGVVTKLDIIRQIGHCTGHTCTDTAHSIMTKDVVTCRATDSLFDVLAMMQARGLVHVPVVDAEGTPSGVVNARDALGALMLEGLYEEALLRDYVMGIGYH